jgi:hypothetical protein
MPLRKKIGESTGIYQNISIGPASGSLDDFAEFMNWLAEGQTPEYALSHIEADAKQVVDQFASNTMRKQRMRFLKTGKVELGAHYNIHDLPKSAPPIAHDAADVLDQVRIVRGHLESKYVALAVVHALRLGRLYERMLVRQAEPFALRGRRQLSKLAEYRRKQSERSRTQGDSVRQQALALWGKNSAKSLTWVRQQLAKAGVASIRTIKTYTKGLKRPPKLD